MAKEALKAIRDYLKNKHAKHRDLLECVKYVRFYPILNRKFPGVFDSRASTTDWLHDEMNILQLYQICFEQGWQQPADQERPEWNKRGSSQRMTAAAPGDGRGTCKQRAHARELNESWAAECERADRDETGGSDSATDGGRIRSSRSREPRRSRITPTE
jgi:hypothetical protein